MHFKLENTIRDLNLSEDYTFDFGGPHDVILTVRRPSQAETASGHKRTNAMCDGVSAWDVKPNIAKIFEQIIANEIPFPDPPAAGSQEYKGPNDRQIRIPSLDDFPEHFRTFIDAVTTELRDFMVRTVGTIRWRTNVQYGSHNPFSSRGLRWSLDDGFWHPAPLDLHVTVEVQSPPRISPEICGQIGELVRLGSGEPLYHNIFREAHTQKGSNPRSAIIAGIGAAELAVKALIASLVPHAEWLAMNAPTPPLVKMLTDYLPLLPAKNTFAGKVKPPPKQIIDEMKKGVTIRNSVTHVGANTPSRETLEKILSAVRDILWLVDYYAGNDWAAEYLSEATRTELRTD
jgi:hypothetical protein